MREIRQSGSEGGVVGNGHPYPYSTPPSPPLAPVGRVPRPGDPLANPKPLTPGELHRKACPKARPYPVRLARRWKVLQKRWSFGVFDRFPTAYEEVLGAEGLNEWQRGENGPS